MWIGGTAGSRWCDHIMLKVQCVQGIRLAELVKTNFPWNLLCFDIFFSLFHSHCGREREIFRASMAAGDLKDFDISLTCPMIFFSNCNTQIVLSNPLGCKSVFDSLTLIFRRLCAKDQRPGGWFGILAEWSFSFRSWKRRILRR